MGNRHHFHLKRLTDSQGPGDVRFGRSLIVISTLLPLDIM